uniref:Armadillo repeat-containing protein 4 n=1 Tax=Macrostomum lignano TaxID=282301 RepID=A0A1I8HY74_9PLAT
YVHVFSNGYRAPNFRQLQGDIAYFLVYLKDTDVICVTAGTKGWFVNKGYSKDTNDVDFERRSDLYGSLFALLRERSRHFRERTSRKSGDGETAADEAADGAKSRIRRATRISRRPGRRRRSAKRTRPCAGLGTSEQQSQERRSARQPQSAAAAAQQSDESDSESGTDEEEDAVERRHESNADLPSEYWQIGKFVRYLKGGNQTSTIISLCALRDFQLNTEVCQLAIRDVGGLEVLLNLLETEENRCKIGSLKILKEISQNPQIRRAIADLGGLQTLVNILKEPSKDLKCLAAETIANVAKFRRARRIVRQHGGIRKLVSLLDCPALNGPTSPEIERDIEVARCGALALWSLSNSTKNKRAMKRAGVIPLLGKLLKSRHEDMLIPVVGTLQECASEPDYRVAIRTEGMVEDLVKNLKSDNAELQMHCASTIFKCAEEEETRDLVRSYDGLEPMVGLLNKTDNKELLRRLPEPFGICRLKIFGSSRSSTLLRSWSGCSATSQR